MSIITAIAAAAEALSLINAGARAGLDMTAAWSEFRQRVSARGDAFDWTDVDHFKAKYYEESGKTLEAIAAAEAEDAGES